MSIGSGARTIMQRGGVAAFYAGFLPNALKNLPNKGVPALDACCLLTRNLLAAER